MDARNDLLTAIYATREASRKAVCAIRASGEAHLDHDRLAYAIGIDYAGLSGTERLLFELVSDTAHDFLAAQPVRVKHYDRSRRIG